MKKILLTFFSLCCIAPAFSQQDPMFTHYMYNTLSVNPAYAGSRQALTVTALHRSQWVGFTGAPTTQTLTLHTPVCHQNIGLGFSFVNDKIGPTKNTAIYIDFAYHLMLNRKSKLAFGLKGGGSKYTADLAALKLDVANQPDKAFSTDQDDFKPNFGFGLYYYRERFYLGASTPKLLKNDLGDDASVIKGTEESHYFVIAGALFNINENLKLKPTTLIKVTEAAPAQADLTASFIFNDRFNLGAMYRTGDAAGLLIGYAFSEQLTAGYSFDWSFVNNTNKYNSGSHEVMLRYDLIFKKQARIRSPRFF